MAASSLAALHLQVVLFVVVILVVVLLTLPSTAHQSHPEASILLALKQGLTSSPTIRSPLDGWDASTYHCSWPGLSCDPSTSLVVFLDLSNFNLSGAIPPSLSSLSSLRHLNLSTNHLNGSVSAFSFPATLQVLDLYDNSLSGQLPHSLPDLLHLDLGGNYFSGTIPSSYGDFRRLEFLSLAGNDLSGKIPPELGNLSTLKQLYLGYYNDFDGGIPPELGMLPNLTHLDLSSCGLDGAIPPELGKLRNLDTLFLQTNQLTGGIPSVLGNLSNLRALDLSNNALTGAIPEELSQLRQLSLFHLFINMFHGDLPWFVSELPELELLQLWQNNFTGTIPRRLGANGRLREVDLSSNRLTGGVPETICLGRRLEILILQNNFLFDPLPDDLGKCSTLIRVRLGHNYLTGRVPVGFLYLPELQLVELQNNYLTGPLPEAPSPRPSLLKVVQINLSDNRLSGNIPSSIGCFTQLQTFLLGGNQFTGEIPLEVGQLKRVLKMDLSRNNLTGSIPVEIRLCSMLSYLDLSQNQLTGSLPPQISEIHILSYLNVSWNHLTNDIPNELGSVKSLTSVDFSHNDFSGQIPQTGQFAYFNSTSFGSNPRLIGSAGCNATSTMLPPDSYPQPGESKRRSLPFKYRLLLALALLACSLLFAATVVVRSGRAVFRRKRWRLTAFEKVQFTTREIVECMKDGNVIGNGGSGVVYRGCSLSGEAVAVKRLLGVGHRDNGFCAEVETLGRIRHRNIVRLLAFCTNEETKVLIYEYMPNGSLGELLHGKRGGFLGWSVRLKIAVEAARGLCYLHHDSSPPILHRDVKSNNILLNAEMEAHVADFGLAKFLGDAAVSESMSAIAGSYGYIAPEYAYTLKVDEKSDVYSFGVVLLELVTGRRPVGDFGEEGVDIVQWVKVSTGGRKEGVVKILDRRLSDVPVGEAMEVLFVAMLCVQEQSVERPTMREVVQMLASSGSALASSKVEEGVPAGV